MPRFKMRHVREAMKRLSQRLGLDWRDFFTLVQAALIATDKVWGQYKAASADGVWTPEEVSAMAATFAEELAKLIQEARDSRAS